MTLLHIPYYTPGDKDSVSARLLKDGLKDSQFSIRYQYLLAALLCCCGKGLREEFDRQCWLVNTLAKLAQQVREAAPSSRQVHVFEYITFFPL